PFAFDANWFRYLKISLFSCAGIKCSARKICNDCWKELKIGNAVNNANATVASGTSASIAVNVRLPATCGIRSSLMRCAANRASRLSVSRSKRTLDNKPASLLRKTVPQDRARDLAGRPSVAYAADRAPIIPVHRLGL